MEEHLVDDDDTVHADVGTDPLIEVTGIEMDGPWGPVYGPLDLTVEAGGVTVLLCPAGPGRTALLLTLAGRMKPRTGSLTVSGHARVNKIFGLAAVAGVDELDTVSESVTVRDLLTERLRWSSPWYRRIPRAGKADVERVCAPVFGDRPLPESDVYVNELEELDGLLLRIALANMSQPPLLVVGNLDQLGSRADRALLVDRLVELGSDQTVITASADLVDSTAVRAQIAVPNASHANLNRKKGL